LPQSLSSLRPISLPTPSLGGDSVRVTLRGPDTSPTNQSTLSPQSSYGSVQTPVSEFDEESTPNEAEIMNLVAANMPSHRGAWRKNSKAWKLFMDHQSNDTDTDDDRGVKMNEDTTDQLEDEYGWSTYKLPEGIAQSLPVTIGAPTARRFDLNKKTIAEEPALTSTNLPLDRSTSGISEEASYRQSRGIDSTFFGFSDPGRRRRRGLRCRWGVDGRPWASTRLENLTSQKRNTRSWDVEKLGLMISFSLSLQQ